MFCVAVAADRYFNAHIPGLGLDGSPEDREFDPLESVSPAAEWPLNRPLRPSHMIPLAADADRGGGSGDQEGAWKLPAPTTLGPLRLVPLQPHRRFGARWLMRRCRTRRFASLSPPVGSSPSAA